MKELLRGLLGIAIAVSLVYVCFIAAVRVSNDAMDREVERRTKPMPKQSFQFIAAVRVSNDAMDREVERRTKPMPKQSFQDRLAAEVKSSKPYAMNVGNWNYTVYFSKRKPGLQLVVNYCLTNNGPDARWIPAPELADDTGAMHACVMDGSLLQKINPGVAVALEVEFVVPEGREYALMAESTMETRLIKLLP